MKQLHPISRTDFARILLEFNLSGWFIALSTLADGIFFTR